MAKVACFTFAILLIAFFAGQETWTQPSLPIAAADAKRWQEDLRYMAAEMPKWHRNLFHSITPAQFESAVAALHDNIPQLARHQIIVEMARIAAMVGDGHTNIAPTRDTKIGFRALPVKLYLFADGLYVRAADRNNAALVGTRVTKIGNVTVEEAVTRAGEIIGRDNRMGTYFFAPHLLVMPEILHALNITKDAESAMLQLELPTGKQQSVLLKPAGPAEMLPPDTDTTWINKKDWVDLRDQGSTDSPLWLKNPNDIFWYQYLPDSKIVYAQINEVGNKDNETLAQFSKRLFAFVHSNPVEKLVFDVRLNRGGDGTLLRPLVLDTVKSKINQPGKLFAIIGRGTWSAAQFFLNDLEKFTNAVFIGEPSSSKGNHYGDSRRITLPHSEITVRVSIYYWQDWFPTDTRQWTAPHVTAELTSADYRENRDPALEAIINYAPQKPLVAVLNEAVAAGGIQMAIEQYRRFKAEPKNKYAATEEPLLIAGSQLLRDKKPNEALALFKINAEEHPYSYRAHFAVGVAYLESGNKDQAIANLKKALELNPKYYDAAQRLKSAMQPNGGTP